MVLIQANNNYLGDSPPFICDAVLLGEHQQHSITMLQNVSDHSFSDTCHIVQDLNPQQTPMRTPNHKPTLKVERTTTVYGCRTTTVYDCRTSITRFKTAK
jgi:hypothetical protein